MRVLQYSGSGCKSLSTEGLFSDGNKRAGNNARALGSNKQLSHWFWAGCG